MGRNDGGAAAEYSRPPIEFETPTTGPDTGGDETEPASSQIVIDPSIRDDATSDGPAGGDPDAFEDLTGIASDWSLPQESMNNAVAAPPIGLPPLDGIPAIPKPSEFGISFGGLGRLLGRLLGGAVGLGMTSTNLGGSRETYPIDNPNGLDVEFDFHPAEGTANVSINGELTDIRVEPVYSPAGEIESFRPVTTADSDRLEELTGASVMSSEEAGETEKPENVNGSDGAEGDGDIETVIEPKIEGQLGARGWDPDAVDDLIDNPDDTREVRDTRWNPDGTRRDDPATAYIKKLLGSSQGT